MALTHQCGFSRKLLSTVFSFKSCLYSTQPQRRIPSIYHQMSHNIHTPLHEQQNDIYFGTEVLNRVLFLRDDADFISRSVLHPSARFVFFKNNFPLMHVESNEKTSLVVLANSEAKGPSLGDNDMWASQIQQWLAANKAHDPEMRGTDKCTFVFMGLEDESVGLDLKLLKVEADEVSSEMETYLDHQGRYQGIPYFAVDTSNYPALQDTVITAFAEKSGADPSSIIFSPARQDTLALSNRDAALFSQGKMFLDWLTRNQFCPGCGHKVIPIHGGGKLMCTSTETDPVTENSKCPVKAGGVSNVTFPRTDAVIITAIASSDGQKMLLLSSKRWGATRMYLCTAGFMEPSETVEIATKREIWEETGVACSRINIALTQPWPFPGNLMIGCIATVDFNGVNEVISLEHDLELADARWFDVDFIRKLVYKTGESDADFNPEKITLPMPESIAHLLIKLMVDRSDKLLLITQKL